MSACASLLCQTHTPVCAALSQPHPGPLLMSAGIYTQPKGCKLIGNGDPQMLRMHCTCLDCLPMLFLLNMLAVYRADLHANGAVPELLATLRLLPALCDPRVVQVRPMLLSFLLVSQSSWQTSVVTGSSHPAIHCVCWHVKFVSSDDNLMLFWGR